MSEYQGCHKCKYGNNQPTDYPCLECEHNRAIDHYEPMTNADRIRNMSDEELAEFISTYDVCSNCKYNNIMGCEFSHYCNDKFNTQNCLEWLQAEAEGDSEC